MMSLSLVNPALAQEKLIRTLTVTGRGVEMIPSTLAQVRLGVQIQGKTAEAVQQEVAQRSTAVVAYLKSRNVQKLETTGINLSPVYSYEQQVQRLTGYQATNTVSFQIGTQQAGALLDGAVKAGATQIDQVSFTATEGSIATAQKQALREATQDAQQQADTVLTALQLTRRDVIGIQVNGASAPPPMPLANAKFAATSGGLATTPAIGGEQSVEASVTLQISY